MSFNKADLKMLRFTYAGHLVSCVFLMHKFLENERQACDYRVWLLEWLQTPLLDLTAKSGSTAKLKIQWTWPENFIADKTFKKIKHFIKL